jgi:hypothetical protein
MSSTESRYSFPSPVLISVPSPYQRRLIPAAANFRFTRSSARHRALPLRVAPRRPRRPGRASSPCLVIEAATVFSLTAQPSSRSADMIRGAPSLPLRAANRAATSASSRSRRRADGGSTPGRHL